MNGIPYKVSGIGLVVEEESLKRNKRRRENGFVDGGRRVYADGMATRLEEGRSSSAPCKLAS